MDSSLNIRSMFLKKQTGSTYNIFNEISTLKIYVFLDKGD